MKNIVENTNIKKLCEKEYAKTLDKFKKDKDAKVREYAYKFRIIKNGHITFFYKK